MPTTYNMDADDEIYRAVLAYDQEQVRYDDNPDTRSGFPRVRVVTGPPVVQEYIIGPYTETRSIKSYMTRNRGRYPNLRIVRVEKVATWEEVDL